EATIIGLGPHARPPRVPVPLLDGDNPLERETNGPDLDLETAPVGSGVRGLNGLDTRNAASDPRDLHHELPQALSLDWDHAFLGEGHGLACARRAASHAWPSARPTITPVISRLYAAEPRWSLKGSTAVFAASPAACKRPSPSASPARRRSADVARSGVNPTDPSATRASRQRAPSGSRVTIAAAATVA